MYRNLVFFDRGLHPDSVVQLKDEQKQKLHHKVATTKMIQLWLVTELKSNGL